jgi:hypothetical protein
MSTQEQKKRPGGADTGQDEQDFAERKPSDVDAMQRALEEAAKVEADRKRRVEQARKAELAKRRACCCC